MHGLIVYAYRLNAAWETSDRETYDSWFAFVLFLKDKLISRLDVLVINSFSGICLRRKKWRQRQW